MAFVLVTGKEGSVLLTPAPSPPPPVKKKTITKPKTKQNPQNLKIKSKSPHCRWLSCSKYSRVRVLPCPASRGAGVAGGRQDCAPPRGQRRSLPGERCGRGEGRARPRGASPSHPPGTRTWGRHPCRAPGSLRCLLRLFKHLGALTGSGGCRPPGAGLVAGSAHCLPSGQACRALGAELGWSGGCSARLPFLGTLTRPLKATDTEM